MSTSYQQQSAPPLTSVGSVTLFRVDDSCDIANAATTDDDSSQFLEDPALYHDILPQPYRRINKLLDEILDAAWDICTEHEAKLLREASRRRPPQYDTASVIEELGNVSCLAASPDGKFVVVCKVDSGGLVCINVAHQLVVAEWKPDNGSTLNFTCVDVHIVAEHVYLISTIDSSGAVRLFTHVVDALFLTCSFYDTDESHKISASQCEISDCTDFIGLIVQQVTEYRNELTTSVPPTTPAWLEIYRLPKETWIKELDPVLQRIPSVSSVGKPDQLSPCSLPGECSSGSEPAPVALSTTTSHAGEPVSAMAGMHTGTQVVLHQSLRAPGSPLPTSIGVVDDEDHDSDVSRNIPSVKFTGPTMTVKIRCPAKSADVQLSSAFQALKFIEAGSVEGLIGTGLSHIISKQHLDLRMMTFEALHQQHAAMLHCKHVDDLIPAQPAIQPHFHFLASTKVITNSQNVGQSTAATTVGAQTTSVAVWWTGYSHVMHYNLNRTTKEMEASHADLVWPMSHPIVATASSTLASLLAVALTNNNITIWDKKIGLCVRVVHLNDHGKIRSMFFHDMSAVGPVMEDSKANVPQLLVESTSGQIYLVSCCKHDTTAPRPIYVEVESDEEIPTVLQPVSGMPQLLAVCRQDGRLYIHDTLKCELLCEVVMPVFETVNLTVRSPLRPLTFATADGGRVLYAIVNQETGADETDIEPQGTLLPAEPSISEKLHAISTRRNSQLLVYKLLYFPTFDHYNFPTLPTKSLPATSLLTKTTLDDHVNATFHARISEQSERNKRMQRRWFELKENLATLLQPHTGNTATVCG